MLSVTSESGNPCCCGTDEQGGHKEKALGRDSSLLPRHREVARGWLGCVNKLNCDIN